MMFSKNPGGLLIRPVGEQLSVTSPGTEVICKKLHNESNLCGNLEMKYSPIRLSGHVGTGTYLDKRFVWISELCFNMQDQ